MNGGTYTGTIDFAGLTPEEMPQPGQFLIGIDSVTKAYMVMDSDGNLGPAGNFVQKYIVNFNDFPGAAQIETLVLGTVPPNAIFNGIKFRQDEDFVGNGISNTLFRVGLLDASGTNQYINSYTGGAVIKEFITTSLAGNNSGVASNDLSGIGANIVFNAASAQNLYVTMGVDARNVGGNIVSLASSIAHVDFVVLDGSTLNEKYFTFCDHANEYYVWYNTGSGVDPAPGGFSGAPIGIEVAISIADTAETIAQKTQVALYATFGAALNLSSSGDKIRIMLLNPIATVFDHSVGTSGFTIHSVTEGNVTPLKVVSDLHSGVMHIWVSWVMMP